MAEDKAETGKILAAVGLALSVAGLAISPFVLGLFSLAFALAGYHQNEAMANIAAIAAIISAVDIAWGILPLLTFRFYA